MNGEPAFDPIALGAKPAPAQTEEFNPIALGAKPAPAASAEPFDPIALGAKPDRKVKLKELEGQIMASVDAPADVKAKLEDDYAKEAEAYRNERGFLGRVKDFFTDTDFKGAVKGLADNLKHLTPEGIAGNITESAVRDLMKQGKPAEEITTGDLLKAGSKAGGKALVAAGTGAAAGAADVLQGTASALAKVGAEASDIVGREDLAAAIDLERVKQSAEKEESLKDLKEGLGLEGQAGIFEGGRMAGSFAPIGLPGGQKVLSMAGKASEKLGEVISAGVKKGAGTALRGAAAGGELSTDAATAAAGIGIQHIPVPGAQLAGGAVAASPLFSETGLAGFSKYIKATKDAIQESKIAIGEIDGKPVTLTPGAALKKINIAEKIGSWTDDVKGKLFSTPAGAGEVIQATKFGKSVVDSAETVGADLIRAQDKVIGELQQQLAKPDLGSFQKSLLTSKLNAAEARQASIAAGIEVVKKLGKAEKITDAAANVLADATLGATAGTALAAATSTPGAENPLAEGLVNGAFYGTFLGSLGRAAIKNAPDNPAATTKAPITVESLDLVLAQPEFVQSVKQNTLDLIKHPAPGIEVVDNVPAEAVNVTPALPGSRQKALRGPLAEELPLGDTKGRAPDRTALRERVEKTQKLIDDLYKKDEKSPLSDDDLVTLENAEATIERDSKTLANLEASELTSGKKSKKVLSGMTLAESFKNLTAAEKAFRDAEKASLSRNDPAQALEARKVLRQAKETLESARTGYEAAKQSK